LIQPLIEKKVNLLLKTFLRFLECPAECARVIREADRQTAAKTLAPVAWRQAGMTKL
jgi:hypothetical protein